MKLLRTRLNVRDAGSRGQRVVAPPPPQYVHMSDCDYATDILYVPAERSEVRLLGKLQSCFLEGS